MRNGSAALIYNHLSTSAIFELRMDLEPINLSQRWAFESVTDPGKDMVHNSLLQIRIVQGVCRKAAKRPVFENGDFGTECPLQTKYVGSQTINLAKKDRMREQGYTAEYLLRRNNQLRFEYRYRKVS